MIKKKISVKYLTFVIWSCNLIVTSYDIRMVRKISILDNLPGT